MKNPDAAHFTRIEQYAGSIYQLYLKTLRDITRLLHSLPIDTSKTFNFNDYPTVKHRVDSYIFELTKKVKAITENAISAEWLQANIKNDENIQNILKGSSLSDAQKKVYFSRNQDGLKAFIQRKEDGLSLSDRVWLYTNQYKNEIEMAVDVAISQKVSAQNLSQTVRQYLQQPETLFRRVRDKNGVLQLSKKAADYHPGRGVYRSSYKNAMRLARTEINMAYRTADHERMNQLPFITGFEVVLSNNHPVKDICDHLKGKYPKEFKFVGWHPNCRCSLISKMVSDEEYNKIEDKLLNGEDVSNYQPSTAIKEVPKGFSNWTADNKDRVKGWSSVPYFMRDNPEFVKGVKAIKTPVEIDIPKSSGLSVREKIEAEEFKIRRNKSFETAKLFNSNGETIFVKKGGSHSVGFTANELSLFKDQIFTHNHPSGAKHPVGDMRRIGNSFSINDIVTAIKTDLSEMRAVTPEFTFIMKRPAAGWGKLEDLKSAYIKADREVSIENMIDINRGITTVKKASTVHYHAIWKKVSKELGYDYSKQRIK